MPSFALIPSSATAVGRYVPAAEVTPVSDICWTAPLMTRLPSWAWIAAAGATTSRRRARWWRSIATMSGSVALRVVRNSGAVMTVSDQYEMDVLAAAARTAAASG